MGVNYQTIFRPSEDDIAKYQVEGRIEGAVFRLVDHTQLRHNKYESDEVGHKSSYREKVQGASVEALTSHLKAMVDHLPYEKRDWMILALRYKIRVCREELKRRESCLSTE